MGIAGQKGVKRHRRVRRLLALALALACLVQASPAIGDNVRGQLRRGATPVPGVSVNLVGPTGRPSGTTYSGHDGMYYLFSIPPGEYTLQVWDPPKGPPMQFRITIYAQPWTDIAPIQLRVR